MEFITTLELDERLEAVWKLLLKLSSSLKKCIEQILDGKQFIRIYSKKRTIFKNKFKMFLIVFSLNFFGQMF